MPGSNVGFNSDWDGDDSYPSGETSDEETSDEEPRLFDVIEAPVRAAANLVSHILPADGDDGPRGG